ncbi:MAG: hypothetical protein DWI02_03550 [Planctomycetota bacterium]|nr:MAG: hypothetical protein DWI02_03550 [Planctomycetota bacterium]
MTSLARHQAIEFGCGSVYNPQYSPPGDQYGLIIKFPKRAPLQKQGGLFSFARAIFVCARKCNPRLVRDCQNRSIKVGA